MDTTEAHDRAPHQLGGTGRFPGPVPGIDDPGRFHEGWEARLFGLWRVASGGGLFTTDQFRHTIERLAPDDYERLGYFERWLAAIERLVVEHGHLTAEELEAARQRRFDGHDHEHEPVPDIGPRVTDDLDVPEPDERLAVGTRVLLVGGHGQHHRLPEWARGQRGTVHAHRGDFELPDLIVAESSRGRRYPLYSVEVPARQAFAEADPSDLLYLDVYQPYLRQEP